jgi:hypothetical protein
MQALKRMEVEAGTRIRIWDPAKFYCESISSSHYYFRLMAFVEIPTYLFVPHSGT